MGGERVWRAFYCEKLWEAKGSGMLFVGNCGRRKGLAFLREIVVGGRIWRVFCGKL